MVEVKKEGILLAKTTLGFENQGVLNPAVISEELSVGIFGNGKGEGTKSK